MGPAYQISSAPAVEFSKPPCRHRLMGFGAEHLGHFACDRPVRGGRRVASSLGPSKFFLGHRNFLLPSPGAVEPELPATAFGRDEGLVSVGWTGPLGISRVPPAGHSAQTAQTSRLFGNVRGQRGGSGSCWQSGQDFFPVVHTKTSCNNSNVSLNKTHRYNCTLLPVPFNSIPSHIYLQTTWVYCRSFQPQ